MNMLAPLRSLSLRTSLPLFKISTQAPSRNYRRRSQPRPVRSARSVMTSEPILDVSGSLPNPDKQNLSMVLKDERKLAWREYGDPNGYPVIFMHGNLNSRLFEPSWTASHADAVDAGAKVLAVDRPGYGQSSFHPNRTYSTWADDVSQLAKHLNISRFGVVGFSSGGPHALACATLLPEAVACCALVSSDGPYAEEALGAAVRKQVYGTEDVSESNSMELCQRNEARLRKAYMAVKRQDRQELALRDLGEATTQGLRGPAQDCVLECGEWGFGWRGVAGPVLIWHGDEDKSVPVAVARHYEAGLAGRGRLACRVLLGEGHNLIRRNWKLLLAATIHTATHGCTSCK